MHMSETSILDQLMPIDGGSANLLAGLPDRTGGGAERYFTALSEEDRELVQWYLMQGITPWEVEEYTRNLVQGYAFYDPQRTSKGGKEGAHAELARVRRHLELFLACENEDFFPSVALSRDLIVDDVTGEEEYIYSEGWESIHDGFYATDIDYIKKGIGASSIMHFMDLADSFIDDPNGGACVFNLEAIIRGYQEEMQADEQQYGDL